jgi:hypothetical protein
MEAYVLGASFHVVPKKLVASLPSEAALDASDMKE